MQVTDELMLKTIGSDGFQLGDGAADASQKRRDKRALFLTHMHFPFPVTIYKLPLGGPNPTLVWVWRRPHGDVSSGDAATKHAQNVGQIASNVNLYQTRAKRKADATALRGLGLRTAGAVEYVRSD